MKRIEPEYAIIGDTVHKIRVGETEIPCHTSVENIDRVDSLMKSLLEHGVFLRSEKDSDQKIKKETEKRGERDGKLDEFVKNLSESEKKLIKILPTEGWISKTKLDISIRLKRRQFHEAMANLNKKAKAHGLINEREWIYEQKFEPEEFHYRLRPEFESLKEMVE